MNTIIFACLLSFLNPNTVIEECGLIQITVIIDNNCNGIYDTGDTYANNWEVRIEITNNSISFENQTTDQNGHAFFGNLPAGSYQSNLTLQNNWNVTNTTQNFVLQESGVGQINYFVCQDCDPEFNITQTPTGNEICCPTSVVMHVQGNYPIISVQWSNGGGGLVKPVTVSGNYSANIQYECNGQRKYITLNSSVNMGRGGFPSLSYHNNAVRPNNPLVFYDNNPPSQFYKPYNATKFHLRIFDRWGGMVYESVKQKCDGFVNGEIKWDGKGTNGNNLQQGQYVGYVVLENCQYKCSINNVANINQIQRRCPQNITYFNVFWLP
ncbi:SdrD B-like domain-containing protein [Portibacter lacus]|uniref:SD-repeat containing protein B domain-containing protein n=1 Tax=Portibacter lacus TaxID=1099794 RepID=A0AA37SP35_9BACT|nr:SdrD B-like domain-containing protein [Portibacter lacus]GLR16584.1 hypothetical protein GCM10007940_11990 [Portibacter lacus]